VRNEILSLNEGLKITYYERCHLSNDKTPLRERVPHPSQQWQGPQEEGKRLMEKVNVEEATSFLREVAASFLRKVAARCIFQSPFFGLRVSYYA
jgi:hypothetical protein